MQTTSAAYAPYPDARFCDMKIFFRLVDTDAAGDATASATAYNTSLSQLAQTHDGTEGTSAKWAAFELGGWPLNESCAIMPDSVSGLSTGLRSVLSGVDGKFSVNPSLTFQFTTDHSSIGFTVMFDDKANLYPKQMIVSAYDSSDVEIGSATVTVTGVTQIVNFQVENYRKIIITFTETRLPYQSVRVSEVTFGIVQSFGTENMTKGTVLYELSPKAESLPSNELTITFDNTDTKYNMTSPDSIFAYLQQGQPLDALLGVGTSRPGIEYVNMGRFYFANAKAQDGSMTAQITAYDRFYQLGKSTCRLGVTGTWTVADAVAAVIADSGLSITTSIPSAIGSLIINKCIPQKATHREALRLIAQAARCTCYFDRSDTLVFAAIAVGTSVDTLDDDNMAANASAEVSGRVNTVELTVSDEYAGTETVYTASDIAAGETAQTLSVDNPLAYDGNSVAAWLLSMAQMRLKFSISEQGNPAREIADTATIKDAYGGNADAVITKEDYTFDGGLSCGTEAVK